MLKKLTFALCVITFNTTQCSDNSHRILYTTKPIKCCGISCAIACNKDTSPTCLNKSMHMLTTCLINKKCYKNCSPKCLNSYEVIDDNHKSDNLHIITLHAAENNKHSQTYVYTPEKVTDIIKEAKESSEKARFANDRAYQSNEKILAFCDKLDNYAQTSNGLNKAQNIQR